MSVETRDGVASLIQINAKSTIETDYMYGSDHVFQTPYKTHTNFDKQPLEVKNSKAIIKYDESNNENANFGDVVVFNVDTKKAEMIGHLCVCVKLPNITHNTWDNGEPYRWTNDIGFAMIEYVKIINGDEELVSYTGQYLKIYHMLNTSKGKQNGMFNMIGHYSSRHSFHGNTRTVYVPIPFMENREDRQYFPLFVSNSQTFQVIVKIKRIQDLIYVPNNNRVHCLFRLGHNSVNVLIRTKNDIQIKPKFETKLLFDTFYLTKEERYLFHTRDSTLLYQFVQERVFRFNADDTEMTLALDFSNAVSALIVCMTPDCALDQNLSFTYDPLLHIKLVLNGVVVNRSHNNNDKMSASRYRYLNSYTNIPNKWVYVIPFCLSSENTQPSGYFDFNSLHKKSTLVIEREENRSRTCTVNVYAITYNKLSIKDGTISSII